MGHKAKLTASPVMATKQVRKEFHSKLYKNPPETVVAIGEASIRKAAMLWHRIFVLGILAGFFIGLGGAVGYAASGGVSTSNTSFVYTEMPVIPKLLSALTFPVGLVMVVLMGAELFTSNSMVMSMGALGKKVSVLQLLANWGLAYLGNFIGTWIVALITWGAGTYAKDPWLSAIIAATESKVNDNWGALFLKGIPCNVLVCSAYMMAVSSEDVVSKVVVIYAAIFTFIASGFEHSIANMFYCTTGILYGADVGYGTYLWAHLLPVTLGNIVGAFVVLSLPYWYVYYLVAAPKQVVPTASIGRRPMPGSMPATPAVAHYDPSSVPMGHIAIEVDSNGKSKPKKSGNGSKKAGQEKKSEKKTASPKAKESESASSTSS